MKNPPPAKGMGFSLSCFEGQQKEVTTHKPFSKPESSQEDRPERYLPYHSPHSFYTDDELDSFVSAHQPEGRV